VKTLEIRELGSTSRENPEPLPEEPNATVLVVDDDHAICDILHRILAAEHYQVLTSQSAAGAFEAIKQNIFDVYLLDYKLPDGSCLAIAERIRSTGSAAPIIVITGYHQSAVSLGAGMLGLFEIIEKPFSRAIVCNVVKKAIETSRAAARRDRLSVC
jgi:two-component system, NtrC family, response regulator HydG